MSLELKSHDSTCSVTGAALQVWKHVVNDACKPHGPGTVLVLLRLPAMRQRSLHSWVGSSSHMSVHCLSSSTTACWH